ncbi:MAG: DNA cytosine methyltransferase [Clostridia bacterium]|nr:DNA cytosine methyltransferase [Clostridia bacterium]
MYSVVDLFAGAGGLSLGFQLEGNYQVVAVVENNEKALFTYLRNHKPVPKIDKDIRNLDLDQYRADLGHVDVVIGGPPCQGFSNANRQKTKFISLNNGLVKKYADVVLKLRPKAFVMENVAMLKSDVHKFFDSTLDHDTIEELGISLKQEKQVIMECNPDGNDMLEVLKSEDAVCNYKLADSVFNGIKVILRYKNDLDRLNNYFATYAGNISRALSEYKTRIYNGKIGNIVNGYVDDLLLMYNSREASSENFNTISKFIDFSTAINLMSELYENKVIFDFVESEGTKIEINVNTYTVYEYLTKRLGKDYNLGDAVLNAKDYGAPQDRRRFILIGILRDFKPDSMITFPERTYDKPATVRDAIGDLEDIEPSKSVSDNPFVRTEFSDNEYTRELQKGMHEIYNHINPDTRETALNRFKHIEQGKNFHSLDKELKEDTYADPSRTQNTIYLRLKYDEPCGTVINVRKSMWIHPVKDRAISVREAARLQTFPDSYIFKGTKDSQYQQVGNAVPPVLAKAIASELTKMLGD